MAVKAQKGDGHGSLKQMQNLINQHQDIINSKLKQSFPKLSKDTIEWVSPLEKDHFAEYTDDDFIKVLGLDPDEIKLKDFWPARGANWDGLAKTDKGRVILVEAKAHIPEMVSPASTASVKSLVQIREALNQTKAFLGKGRNIDWSGTFYQYTNRVAHLYYLREVCNKEVYLINVYFVGDESVKGPKTIEEWKGAIQIMQLYLGLHSHKLKKYMADIFIDVQELSSSF